jgi:hypothetical protein
MAEPKIVNVSIEWGDVLQNVWMDQRKRWLHYFPEKDFSEAFPAILKKIAAVSEFNSDDQMCDLIEDEILKLEQKYWTPEELARFHERQEARRHGHS